jgi:hypothetical protein
MPCVARVSTSAWRRTHTSVWRTKLAIPPSTQLALTASDRDLRTIADIAATKAARLPRDENRADELAPIHCVRVNFLRKRMGLLHRSYSSERAGSDTTLLPRRVPRFHADCRLGGQYGLTIGPQKFPGCFRQRNGHADNDRGRACKLNGSRDLMMGRISDQARARYTITAAGRRCEA